MKKWKTVKDEYHNINNILNFHRSTMHHKSNMSVNHIIPVIDNLLTKDNEEDSRIVEIDPAELKENEDEFFKILEQRRTSWQFGTPMNREQLSALLTKAFGISQRRKFGEFWVNLKTYASAGALYSVEPYIYINDVEDGKVREAAVANVVLNFIFIRIFGYVAAGYTTLACYILYSVGHYVVSKRILVAEGIEENLMDAGFLLACSAFLIGVSVICNLLFPYRILRYAILFASAGLVFWKWELLLNTMADIRKK